MPSILEKLGVRSVINAWGTVTKLGGSVLDEDIIDAMREASTVYLDMDELHVKAGRYVAGLLGAEDAYITSGAGAGMVLAIASCISNGDIETIAELPFPETSRVEVIMQAVHRNAYDSLIQIAGGRTVIVGSEGLTTRSDIEKAISDKTAAVMYFDYEPLDGALPLDSVIAIAHARSVPVIVDAAAELPPASNLAKHISLDADAVLFSVGKDMGGPNDVGIVVGRRHLIETCRNMGPHSIARCKGKGRAFVGRPMKTSKEDILAAVRAIERYSVIDHDARVMDWNARAENMCEKLSKIPSMSCRVITTGTVRPMEHPRPRIVPRVEVNIIRGKLSNAELFEHLKSGYRPIYAYMADGLLYINPQCLRNEEDEFIVERIRQTLED